MRSDIREEKPLRKDGPERAVREMKKEVELLISTLKFPLYS